MPVDNEEAKFKALHLASRIEDRDSLRLVIAMIIGAMEDKPGLTPIEYVNAVEQVAMDRGFIQ